MKIKTPLVQNIHIWIDSAPRSLGPILFGVTFLIWLIFGPGVIIYTVSAIIGTLTIIRIFLDRARTMKR